MIDSAKYIASYLSRPGPHRLEIGAGCNTKRGWLATDFYEYQDPNGAYVVPMNAARPFPSNDACFDYVYSEHMIEHIPLNEGRFMLSECFRILKPGGTLRIVTPYLGMLTRLISADRNAFEKMYTEWSIRTFVPDAPGMTNAVFLNNFMRNWGHVFIYDYETLRLVLSEARFQDIRECHINESEHACLANLEDTTRMPAGFLELESMIVEARKPY